MSGWDKSSTPTWGSQDDPEEAKAGMPADEDAGEFGAQDSGTRDLAVREPGRSSAGSPADGFGRGSLPSGPPPEFFSDDYGQDQPETGPAAFPRRTPGQSLQNLPRHAAPRETSFGQPAAYGRDSGFGHAAASRPEGGFGQHWGADAGDSRDDATQADGGGRRPAAPWDEQPLREADFPALGFPGPDYPAQEFGTQRVPGPASRDFPPQEFTGPGFADQGPASGPEQQAYGGSGFDPAAQLDPALRDFFGPGPGGPGRGAGGPGLGTAQPGKPGESGTWTEWWSSIPSRQQSTTSGTPLIPASRSARPGLGPRAYVAIGVLVAVVIVVAVVVLTRKSGGSSPTAASTPSSGAPSASAPAGAGKTAAAARTAGSGTSGTGTSTSTSAGAGSGAAPAYVLSAPHTAGGYPKGADPDFVTTTKSAGEQVISAAGGGAKVKGSPVSAAYRLPVSGQVVTFVGYHGTFAPAKVAKALAALGTDLHAYPAGPHGGTLSCFNTPAQGTLTSGAVCVWATASTLGVTEFFNSTGPESLTASQDKGATDTVNMRADLEARA